MPHKRQKKSVRDAEHKAKGFNLAPAQSKDYNDTPRGALRIFDSIKLQTNFRANGRTNSEDTGEKRKKVKPETLTNGESSRTPLESRKGKEKEAPTPKPNPAKKEALPKIRDNESLADYNRRIESLMRPGVSKAIKSANSVLTQQVKEAKEAKQKRKQPVEEVEEEVVEKKRKGVHDVNDAPKEFKTVQRRRLNDVAQAPPMLEHLKKGMGSGGKKKNVGGETSAWKATGRLPVNAGQERLLAQERERVVKAYREIKAGREKQRAEQRAALGQPEVGKVVGMDE